MRLWRPWLDFGVGIRVGFLGCSQGSGVRSYCRRNIEGRSEQVWDQTKRLSGKA